MILSVDRLRINDHELCPVSSSVQSPPAAGIDWPIDPDHLGALTPTAKQQLFGEPESLIVVHVNLTDPERPQLADDPVSIEEMSAGVGLKHGQRLLCQHSPGRNVFQTNPSEIEAPSTPRT